MKRLYEFVGPDRLRPDATAGIPRYRLHPKARAPDLLSELEIRDLGMTELTLTYIVDQRGMVWVAERHVEHIACARGEPVLAAGELTVDLSVKEFEILAATNQSTGYCPEPECWHALAEALDAAGLDRPDGFEYAFRFGRCRKCRSITVIKEDDFSCAECGSELDPLRQ